MISLLMLLLVGAAGHRVVGEGDTLASIAEELGDPGLEPLLRKINGLEEGEEPGVGAILGLPPAEGLYDQAAEVQTVRGQASMDRGLGPVSLSPGMLLTPGARICTSEDSFLTVKLAVGCTGEGGDEISLLPQTCITLDDTFESGGKRSSLVTMEQGSVTVQEDRAGESGLVTVQTSAGVASGRGGGFRVHVEDQATRTEALATAVSVSGSGAEVGLEAGQGVRVKEGEVPGPVVQLAAPGTPALPADQSLLRIPDFSWAQAPDALAYRLEFASDPSFSDLLFFTEVGDTPWLPDTFSLPTKPDTGVYWRVTTIDSMGFMGMPSPAHYAKFPPGVRP